MNTPRLSGSSSSNLEVSGEIEDGVEVHKHFPMEDKVLENDLFWLAPLDSQVRVLHNDLNMWAYIMFSRDAEYTILLVNSIVVHSTWHLDMDDIRPFVLEFTGKAGYVFDRWKNVPTRELVRLVDGQPVLRPQLLYRICHPSSDDN